MVQYIISEEQYLIDLEVTNKMKELSLDRSDLNYSEPYTNSNVMEFTQSFSLFATNKLGVIKEIEDEEGLIKVLEMVPDEVTILIVCQLDKRKKLYKWLKKQKFIKEISVYTREGLCKWIQEIGAENNTKLTLKDAGLILNRTSTADMNNIKQEVIKLCYMKMPISPELINKVVKKTITSVSFDLTNAMLAKDIGTSLVTLSEIGSDVNTLIPLIALLNKNFSTIRSLRKTSETTLKESGIDGYTLKNLRPYSRDTRLYTDANLVEYIKATEKSEFDLKNGVDPKNVIEKLIFMVTRR